MTLNIRCIKVQLSKTTRGRKGLLSNLAANTGAEGHVRILRVGAEEVVVRDTGAKHVPLHQVHAGDVGHVPHPPAATAQCLHRAYTTHPHTHTCSQYRRPGYTEYSPYANDTQLKQHV